MASFFSLASQIVSGDIINTYIFLGDNMKVYFTASARGLEEHREDYKTIHNLIDDLGHRNLDDIVVDTDPASFYEGDHKAQVDLYEQAMRKIRDADVIILEVTKHSLSMGFVMHSALDLGKPVIALYKKGNKPFFAAGIEDDRLQVLEYEQGSLQKILEDAIAFAKDRSDIRFNFFISPTIASYLDWIAKDRRIPRSVYLRRLIDRDMKDNKDYNKGMGK